MPVRAGWTTGSNTGPASNPPADLSLSLRPAPSVTARKILRRVAIQLGALSVIGQGTTYWEYSGNHGNGNLTVKFDSTEPGLAPKRGRRHLWLRFGKPGILRQ